MRALAVTSSQRADDLPNVPTINESGYKGFDARTWFGVVAPAGTPPAIVAELNAEINKVLAMPEVRKKITVEGGDVMGGSPEQFGALIKTEIPRWGKVVKDSGARID
jgi:tripartite-type tricarboxylate transporter receptor subunit TctC